MSSAGSTGFNAQAAAEQLAAFTTDTAPPGRRLPAQQSGAPGAGADFIQAGLLHNLTDRGNAKLFAYLHHNRFRHVEGLGWYVWDEYRWKRTGGEKAAIWAAGDMAEDLPAHDPAACSRIGNWPSTAGAPCRPRV